MYRATLEGDYRANNKEGTKLVRFFKKFEKNPELAKKCIPMLLMSKNVVVQAKGAAYCLSLGMNVEQAETILANIANNPQNGIFAFNAQMTLNMWKKDGYVRIYQGQDIEC